MRALHAMERRLQDLERKIQGKERLGKIVDVKFEKQRWYVKLNDGDDDTPSGSGGKRGDTVKSDWQPWKSFSHGTIKSSVPPKKGQYALLRSVNGMMELSTAEPYHYGPENPSPHDKQDEIVHLIEDDEDQQGNQGGSPGGSGGGMMKFAAEGGGGEGGGGKYSTWQRVTKDLHHLIIQKKGANMDALGDLGGLGGLAGLSGLDMSNFAGAFGNLGNLGNIANLNLGNIADFSQISNMINISNLSKFANLGTLAQAAGLGHLTSVGNIVQSVQTVLGGGSLAGGGAGGGAGGSGGDGGGQPQQKQQSSRKIPEIEEEGHSETTQVLADKEKVLKTVGDKKSYYRQDEEKIHIRYGEQDEKADVLMDEEKVKVQFKDKKAMVKWTEEDLTCQMGEDDKSKMVMTEEDITMTQGGDDASKVVMDKDKIWLTQGGNAHVQLKQDSVLMSLGETSLFIDESGLTVTAGGTFWKFSGSGLHQTGGDVGHNKKSIGFMHIHGATPPPSLPFQGDTGSPHTGGPTDAGGGPDPGTGTA